MGVITVSRQFASGGSEIAQLVARRLGWTVIDGEFVERVARLAGLPAEQVAEREERVAGLMERVARALAVASPEVFIATGETPLAGPGEEADLVSQTETVISQAAQEGNVVLVGRGAQAYLAERGGTLHVYVVAPFAVRVERAMQRLGLSHRDAERAVAEIDDGRRRYVRTHYGRTWEDAANYHVVINSDAFTYEQAAELVVAAAAIRGWR